MTPAAAAIRAARNYGSWGIDAAIRYAAKFGASFSMVEAAIEFEARRKA